MPAFFGDLFLHFFSSAHWKQQVQGVDADDENDAIMALLDSWRSPCCMVPLLFLALHLPLLLQWVTTSSPPQVLLLAELHHEPPSLPPPPPPSPPPPLSLASAAAAAAAAHEQPPNDAVESSSVEDEAAVDLVYSWVNGSDPLFREAMLAARALFDAAHGASCAAQSSRIPFSRLTPLCRVCRACGVLCVSCVSWIGGMEQPAAADQPMDPNGLNRFFDMEVRCR
jgi:hypothetical protein